MPAAKGPTKTVQFRDFRGGMNRTDARTALKDNQSFNIENFQPIGSGQLQSLPPRGEPIETNPVGIVKIKGINIKIGGVEVARIISVNSDGSIDAINPLLLGSKVVIGGPGTVTDKVRMTMWEDNPLLIGDPTKGYMSWDGVTLVQYPYAFTGTTHTTAVVDAIAPNTTGLTAGMKISGSGVPLGTTILSVDTANQITLSAATTSSLVGTTLTIGAGAPSSVRDLTVFEGRVWLVTGLRAITFTAPASYTDFSPGDGAGTASIIDSVFVGSITGLLSALELNWIMGPSAVNTISNVQAVGSPVVTTFSNTNIVADVGTVKVDSIASFFRTFLFLTPYGVYAIVGATPQKLSDDLDGLFPLLSNASTELNPAATFSLNEVFVWAVMVHYADPLQGQRPILLCFARNAWFVGSQGNDLIYITGLVDPDTGQKQLWGTNGNSVFQCFVGTGANVYQWQTKLWDFGAFTSMKQALRVGFEFSSSTGAAISPSVFIENENTSVPVAISPTPNVGVWLDLNGTPGTWLQADGFTPGEWLSAGGFQLSRAPVNFSGHYLGMRVQGESVPFTISAFALEYDMEGEWT